MKSLPMGLPLVPAVPRVTFCPHPPTGHQGPDSLLFWGITMCSLALPAGLFQTVPRPFHHVHTFAAGPRQSRAAKTSPGGQSSLRDAQPLAKSPGLSGRHSTDPLSLLSSTFNPRLLHRWEELRRASSLPPPDQQAPQAIHCLTWGRAWG